MLASGLPRAVSRASAISAPPTTSQAPGSSATTIGFWAPNPIAVFALLLITRKVVPVARWRMFNRVVLSAKR